MSNGEQSAVHILPEYAVDNLGTSFKVILVDSVECSDNKGEGEINIPDYQGLMKKIAITRSMHPMKLRGGDIKFIRKTLGLKSKELSKKLDVTAEHLSRCENGDKILSPNSEKVLRSLVILEAVYVLERAIKDTGKPYPEILGRISNLLSKLGDVVSGLKISSVQHANDELILYFRRVKIKDMKPANDHEKPSPLEWLDQAA